MEKALRVNFATLFPRGFYGSPPPLIAVEGISALTLSKQLKPGVTQHRFSLFLMNYIHIYRHYLKICFLLVCSSPDGETLLGSFVTLYFLVGFGSGVAGYFEH